MFAEFDIVRDVIFIHVLIGDPVECVQLEKCTSVSVSIQFKMIYIGTAIQFDITNAIVSIS